MIIESAEEVRTMTALEMSEQLEWAEAIVYLSGGGHFHAEGRVNVVCKAGTSDPTDVWVGALCLMTYTKVNVVGDTVRVHCVQQGPGE